MATFYLAVFVIGFALSVTAFLVGAAGHSFGVDLHWGHGHADGGHGGDSGHLSALNFGTVTAFMTWFGGIGFLLTAYSGVLAVATIAIALVFGAAGAGIVFAFMQKVLVRDQIALNPSDYHLPGTLGRITITVPSGGTGEMVYTQGGSRKTVAARDRDGQEIPRGTEVVVLHYQRGIAYVRAWDQLADERPQAGLPR